MIFIRQFTALVLTLCTWGAARAESVQWVRPEGADMAPIFAQAQQAKKPVFLYWGAVWCPPCNQVKATVFNRPDFIERSRWFIPVYLDGDTPGAQKLGAQFKVRGYPTMILLNRDGSEITRLPGEVDANMYMQVLSLGLASGGGGVKASLARVLDGAGGSPTAADWQLLAYYAWEQDEGQVAAKGQLLNTLDRLVNAPGDKAGAERDRLVLKAAVAAKTEGLSLPATQDYLGRVQRILANPRRVQANADVLVNYAADLVAVLAPQGGAQRSALIQSLNRVLQQLAGNTGLSKLDRLAAVQAQVALAKPVVSPELRHRAQMAARAATAGALTPYERQALIPAAADLLSQVQLLAESDALLKAELGRAVSPYYHMLILAANARTRGDVAQALDWSEKAWSSAQGSATRLQWGVGYVGRLVDLAPDEVGRIETAAAAVLGEVPTVPESFYERNRRGLERLGKKLQAWASLQPSREQALVRLQAQWRANCATLQQPDDESRRLCETVLTGTQ